MTQIQERVENVREKVREAMSKKGITVAKIVRLTELSRATVDRFLGGSHNTSDATIAQIAHAVGLEYDVIEQRAWPSVPRSTEPLADRLERVGAELFRDLRLTQEGSR